AKSVEPVDDSVRLRRAELEVAGAAVSPDRLQEVIRAAVVKEEDPLAETPERGGPELVATGRALQAVVGAPGPHAVNRQLREQVHGLVALDRKQLVGDPHLDVVRLAGEEEQRLVLRLPAEPGDASVVPVPVGTTADAEDPLGERVAGEVGDNRAVGDLLDQPGAEDRRGDPEDDVVVEDLPLEIRLLDGAADGIRVPGDHEEGVDAAVASAVGIVLEA